MSNRQKDILDRMKKPKSAAKELMEEAKETKSEEQNEVKQTPEKESKAENPKKKTDKAKEQNKAQPEGEPEQEESAEESVDKNPFHALHEKYDIIKKEKPAKRQIAIYIEEQVAKQLDSFSIKHGKGAKSELINDLLTRFFEANPQPERRKR